MQLRKLKRFAYHTKQTPAQAQKYIDAKLKLWYNQQWPKEWK